MGYLLLGILISFGLLDIWLIYMSLEKDEAKCPERCEDCLYYREDE